MNYISFVVLFLFSDTKSGKRIMPKFNDVVLRMMN